MVLRVQRTEAGQRRRQHATKQFCLADAANFQQLFAWHAEGKLKPLVSQTFPLTRGGEAIDALGQRKAVGKVVVQVKA